MSDARVERPNALPDPFNAIITAVDPAAGAAATGPLAGRTLLVKDLIDTAGIRTTYGSRLYAAHVPTRNATVVERAVRAGAVDRGQGEPAGVRLERARAEPVVRNGAQSARTRE